MAKTSKTAANRRSHMSEMYITGSTTVNGRSMLNISCMRHSSNYLIADVNVEKLFAEIRNHLGDELVITEVTDVMVEAVRDATGCGTKNCHTCTVKARYAVQAILGILTLAKGEQQ